MLTSIAAVLVAFAPPLPYDAAQPAVGRWTGTASTAGASTMLMLDINPNNADTSVAVTAIGIGVLGMVAVDVVMDGASITFGLEPPTEARFEAKVSDDGQSMHGRVVTNGDERTIELERSVAPRSCDDPLAFEGTLDVGTELGMRFTFAKAPNGLWVACMDVPLQGLRGFPLVDVVNEDGAITASVPYRAAPAVDARIRDDHLVGTFRQGGLSVPFDFSRVATAGEPREPRRPQVPEPPFPYTAREIEFKHPDGFVLAGTLTIPDARTNGPGPYPTVILISGSGQQDRDESLLGHKPFLIIADRLSRAGIAVVRYDDRGVGGSGGRETLDAATSIEFATDTLAVLEHVARLPEVDPRRLGLLGHSEGGLIAPIVALRSDRSLGFVVLLAGPGVPGRELLGKQTELMWAVSGLPADAVERWGAIYARALEQSASGAAPDAIAEVLLEIAREQLAEETMTEESLQRLVGAQAQTLSGAWMRFFLAFDPTAALAALKCPVLALNGTLDLQVWHEQNLDAIERIVTEAGGDVTAIRYEGLNHLFQPATTGAPSEYAEIETTIDERVLADIARWIGEKTGG